jgi:HK97 family phage major capsid protein
MVDINRGTTGVNLPADVASEIWGGIVEQSAVMRAARQINLPGRGVSIPLITGEATAGWVDETDEKPVSRATLDNKTMTPYTLAVIEPFSNQFRRDVPALYNELVRRLPFALGKHFDETVFGVRTAPGSNFDQLDGAPQASVDATDTFGDLAAVLNTLAAAGADLSAWIASPALHGRLLTATDNLGRQFFLSDPANQNTVGSVFGAPVYRTRAEMQTNQTGVAGDFAGSAVYGTVEGIQISISDQATLTDGAATINLWQRNMFAVRAEVEVGFRVRDLDHFVQINNGTAIP